MSTTTPPSPADIAGIQDQFFGHLLMANASLTAMRRAFDQLVAARGGTPGVPTEPVVISSHWSSAAAFNPLVDDSAERTCALVATYLEAQAAAAESIGNGIPSERFGDGLAQALWVAICALRAHGEPPFGARSRG